MPPKKIIFTLCSSRSGTRFLAELFNRNAQDCVALHEPQPFLVGALVRAHTDGWEDPVKKAFVEKRRHIDQLQVFVYLESAHTFLLSFCNAALSAYPGLELVHLIRNPLEVARSQRNRWNKALKGSNQVHLHNAWTLKGTERIFRDAGLELSEYQKFLVHWIEIENRAMRFIEESGRSYFTISMLELNDLAKVYSMFNFFGCRLKDRKGKVDFSGERNANKEPTIVTDNDIDELKEVIQRLPVEYLTIFEHEPYTDFGWLKWLKKR